MPYIIYVLTNEAMPGLVKIGRTTRLGAIGINAGDELSFSRSEQVTATVVSENQVFLNGETLAFSPAAVRVLQSMGWSD